MVAIVSADPFCRVNKDDDDDDDDDYYCYINGGLQIYQCVIHH